MIRFRRRHKIWMMSAAILAVLLFLAAPLAGTDSGAHAQPPYPPAQAGCDVNGDSQETIQDALLIAQQVVGLISLDDASQDPADCNGSGDVSISDALLVAQKVVGLA
jgi:hypothetical protein